MGGGLVPEAPHRDILGMLARSPHDHADTHVTVCGDTWNLTKCHRSTIVRTPQ
jgi:hypothetical protein